MLLYIALSAATYSSAKGDGFPARMNRGARADADFSVVQSLHLKAFNLLKETLNDCLTHFPIHNAHRVHAEFISAQPRYHMFSTVRPTSVTIFTRVIRQRSYSMAAS